MTYILLAQSTVDLAPDRFTFGLLLLLIGFAAIAAMEAGK